MKIRNNSKQFEIRYDHKDFTIPFGDMEISDEAFATFIIAKGRKWDLDVSKIGVSNTAEVKPIEAITEVEKETEEEEKEEKKTKGKTTKKTK